MTTVEQHRSTHHLLSDAPSQSHRRHPAPDPIARTRRIPPSVPSPPPLRHSPTPEIRLAKSPLAITSTMAFEPNNQWLFSDAEIASTPSILDGVQPIDERCRRAKGVNFIIQAGILLRLPQLTLATASVFFHRFYMRISMVPEKGGQHHYVRPSSPAPPTPWKLPHSKAHSKIHKSLTFQSLEQNIAATALFLATKTEENCRKTKEIVIAVAKTAQKNNALIIDEQSKEYWRWKDNILTFEEHMLEMLTFDVVLKSPYNYLFDILQVLQIEDEKAMRNYAWTFISDSCMTPLCLVMPSKDIAIASVYFAAKVAKEGILDDDEGGPWWQQVGGTPERIIKAIKVMNEFWVENPLGKPDNAYGMSPLPLDDDLDLTRKPNENASVGESSPEDQQDVTSQDVNGSKTSEKEEITSPLKAHDIPVSTTESDTVDVEVPTIVEPGSSDANLKAVANDPTTHEKTASTNGLAATLIESPPKATPKRKSMSDTEMDEVPTKRIKVEGSPESEEGEVDS